MLHLFYRLQCIQFLTTPSMNSGAALQIFTQAPPSSRLVNGASARIWSKFACSGIPTCSRRGGEVHLPPLNAQTSTTLCRQYQKLYPFFFKNRHNYTNWMCLRSFSKLRIPILLLIRSLGALSSSWRPFGPLDFILCALQAVWPTHLYR